MDFSPKLTASLLALPTIVVGAILYAAHRFTTRISPTIPYAGEESLSARLKAPIEYGKDPVEFLRKTRKKLGDVFCVDLFAFKLVFVLGPEGNKAILRAPEEKISFLEQIKWAMGATLDGMWDVPSWNALSFKLIKFALQKQERLQTYASQCSKVTEEHFEKWAAKGKVPLFESISHLVIADLLVILVGEEFYRKYGDELIPIMAQFERDLQNPILRIVPNALWGFTKPGKALFKAGDRFDELIKLELEDIMSNPEKHKGRGDYFYYIITQCGDKYKIVYGKHIMSVVFGGHANAAMTVPWIFLHARRTPGALDRIREEARLSSDVRKPYLDACLRETGRLYTNTTMMRLTQEATEVVGHTIPANTFIACSPLATQRTDSSEPAGIFDDAAHWNPDRFLADGAYNNWFQRVEFVQFGLGAHACPGEKLARVLIFDLMLKTWMEKYDIEVVSGLEEGVKGVDGVGAEGAWTEENFGTPSIRGEDVIVSVKRRDGSGI
ncbi:cytochrome P450 [Fomitiporia mediterranea MF3/22]|uniref:cytochrome P450 n=1 Tax=Fomitiporia mediterranea (strain MF3/22) TaxID=694068 RepID=UPI0004407B7B|nr:cytochrome P450 [Fomitiporia mediterranea MF3/22]EJD00757.1 cytochrome P450 [Fomitiporia mediterranea MF3/22]